MPAINFRSPEWVALIKDASGFDAYYEFSDPKGFLSRDALFAFGISLFWSPGTWRRPSKQIAAHTVVTEDLLTKPNLNTVGLIVGGIVFGERVTQPIYLDRGAEFAYHDLDSKKDEIDTALLKAFNNAPDSHRTPFTEEDRRIQASFIPPMGPGPGGPSEIDRIIAMNKGIFGY